MATTPSTLVIFTEDTANFPIKTAYVVMKQLFQYGVKEIKQRGEKIFLKLSYSPKAKTLKKKFGYLPVRYMRAKLDNEEEYNILEKVVRKYKFNLMDEELDENEELLKIKQEEARRKNKLYLESASLEEIDDDLEYDRGASVARKRKQPLDDDLTDLLAVEPKRKRVPPAPPSSQGQQQQQQQQQEEELYESFVEEIDFSQCGQKY